MKDIQAIARYMRLPEEQLKFPVELLNQGYEPNYLANYRPDELGNIDEQTLSILRRALNYSESLKRHKEKVQQTLEREQQWNETVSSVVSQANTISQVDTVTRHLRARRNSRSIVEACPQVEAVGQAILTMQGDAPKDLVAWTAEVAAVPVEQASEVLEHTKQWMIHLLSEDVRLIQDLQRTLLKRAGVSVKILPDPPKGSDAEKQLESAEKSGNPILPSEAIAPPATVSTIADLPVEPEAAPTSTTENNPETPVGSVATESTSEVATEVASETTTDAASIAVEPAVEVAPLIADFNQGRKSSKGLKTKSLSDKQLSPRQRRRKWLRSILESYARLKKQLVDLTPYQILMLARGQRSQIIAVHFHYDEKPLIQVCRESLCPGRHPMHHWLLEVSEQGLRNFILPRLHQDVFTILEEDAHMDLTEAAVVHLQASLLQRPVRGHRILVIDSIGPKMAAVAIVDVDGKVLFTSEIACNSNRADVVAQNVVALGQWVHEHKVTLLALSNGPARRYLIHTVSELMKQSSEGSLYWTMVDRAGADGYCMSRGCLVELPRISRRHRAATWLAWRLQDPLKQILKVDPVRLRLGSYQRELPQRELEAALNDAVSAAITQAGVDVFHAELDTLKRIPGMTSEAAKAVLEACHSEKITNRETLKSVLSEHLSEMQVRQALGFLKIYGSNNTLDGTTIHPDDYRLAERLVEHAKLPLPEAAPEGWSKPDFAKLAAATEAASVEHARLAAEQPFAASLDDASVDSDHDSENAADGFVIPDDLTSDASQDEVAAAASDSLPVAESPASESPIAESPAADSVTAPAAEDQAIAPQVESAEGSDVVASDSVDSPSETSATSAESEATSAAPTINVAMPPIPTSPLERPTLSIDVERLARSWQVGREKMKRVANCLQFSFADSRDFQFPISLQSKVPKLDALTSGSMLQAMVIGVADFGVFVDLGPECSGLIHISRLAADFIEDPHQFVQVGDLVTVWVLNVDEKKKRVSLTAIPPGTPSRRNEGGFGGQADGSQNRGAPGSQNAGRDQRGLRPDRNAPAGSQDSRAGGQSRDSRPTGGNRPQGAGAGTGAGDSRGARTGDNRGPAGGGRGNSRGGDSRGDNRGGRPGGRDGGDRDRNRRSNETESSQNRRPARVEPPKPVTPISEAMQQGKEPLRSFSDLLQFIKKPKDDVVTEQVVVTPPVVQEVVREEPANEPTSSVSESLSASPSVDQGDGSAPTA